MGMYQTIYMMDYKPYPDGHQQPHTSIVDHAEKLTLEAQLKAKEFAQPFKHEPVKYAEDPPCQEVQPPFPTMMERRWGQGQDVPPPTQPVKEAHQKDFHTALPTAQNFLQHSPLVKSVATLEKEAERLSQQTDPNAMPDDKAVPCVKDELGQNWDNYQQFLLESHRARHTQAQEIKKLSLGCSVLQEDFISGADASTYQQDYRYWPRVRTGFCRAQRNFSNLLFEDGYYNE
uniref:Uncharacterized protein n=1 Tax=Sphaerodactylus townsendi TaxID=933632 RepID=A0ACB8FU33_9SAUR